MKKLYRYIDYFTDPLYLAGLCLVLCVTISTIGMALGWFQILETYALFPWMIAAAMLLYYSFYTGITLMVASQTMQHWSRAIYGFGGYTLSSGLFAWVLSGKSLYEASTYQSIFIILTLSFFVFLGIGTSVKAIVTFTENRDKQMAEKHQNNRDEKN